MISKPSKLKNDDTDKDRQKALRAAPDAGRGAKAARPAVADIGQAEPLRQPVGLDLGLNEKEDRIMKKFMKSIQMMAALLLAVAATTACSNDDNAIDETTPATTGAPKTYTLTVTASKGGEATTRALSIDDKGALNATWTKGDAIRVMKRREMPYNVEFALLGTLKATTVSADGLTATFTGSLDADKVTTADGLAEGDKLLLGYPGTNLGSSTSAFEFNYNGQDGTLEKIATKYDYCMTPTLKSKMVTVESVDAMTGEVTTSGTASFTNQQAIVRFTLYDGTTPFCPTSLDITAVGLVQSVDVPESGDIAPAPSEQTLTLTPDGSTNVIYAALRGISGQTVKLRARNGDKYFTYTTNSAVTFTRGKFYDVKVKMYKTTNLAKLSGDYTTSDYEVLTGMMPIDKHVTIPDGATVMLDGVHINAKGSAGIICKGTANIILIGTNTVRTNGHSITSIQAGGSGTTLTISGSGSLTATSEEEGAGIGSGKNGSCGDITITGGTVTATSDKGAGIGSGQSGSCGNITITGGTVTAMGDDGAGIGSGFGGSCDGITITGGTVKANSGYGAGIGSGSGFGKCGDITITDGVSSVTASKDGADYSIGRGKNGSCGKVTIGGTVYYDGTTFYNGGDTYLDDSPLIYKP